MYNSVVNVYTAFYYLNAVHDSEVAYNLAIGTDNSSYIRGTDFHGNGGITIGIETAKMLIAQTSRFTIT